MTSTDDLNFIKSIMINKEFYVNGIKIPYENFNFKDKKDLNSRIKELDYIKKRLKYYGVKTDFNLKNLTHEDDFKLSLLMETNPSTKVFNINLSESNLLKIKISNIFLILIVKENKNKEFYEIEDFFTSELNVTYIPSGQCNHVPISQFLILQKEGLLADNINAKKILKGIKKYHMESKDLEYVNNFLLEAIKAYDDQSNQHDELRYLIYKLSEWLYEESREDYIFLNLAQVKYRLGKLKEFDLQKIRDIRLSNEDNCEILAATSILLGEKENARSLINKIELEKKEMFISYPIYSLLDYKNTHDKK
ncbi:hypothetical protein [Senegalia sp. (in: firmicutes)]|uniref:hypothetical protein n=1 Tax=Senegalia sp. (in: firmicutes) TaxID=1924098 RepID=UPI003F96108A